MHFAVVTLKLDFLCYFGVPYNYTVTTTAPIGTPRRLTRDYIPLTAEEDGTGLTGMASETVEHVVILLATNGKYNFHEMNGDVGMAGWK